MKKPGEWKTGASVCLYKQFTAENLRECADAGITAVEVSAAYAEDFPAIAKEAAACGIELWSTHLRFSHEWDISHETYTESTLTLHEEHLRKAAAAGFKLAVVHPSAEPIADEDRRARLMKSRESLLRLAAFAKALGMRLAVENLPRTCLGHTSGDINYLLTGNPDLGVCLDTNHLLIEDNLNFIRRLGKRIITLHVSDYDFIDERHLLPGDGKNDWPAIMRALAEAGYEGPWMHEVSAGKGSAADLRRTHLMFAAQV